MKKLTLFYLENCPYCHNAMRALKELREEKAEYNSVEIQWVEESRQPALAAEYEYYYVPTVYCEGKKLYEAKPLESFAACKENLRSALEIALN